MTAELLLISQCSKFQFIKRGAEEKKKKKEREQNRITKTYIGGSDRLEAVRFEDGAIRFPEGIPGVDGQDVDDYIGLLEIKLL